jgi:hypothetical protein
MIRWMIIATFLSTSVCSLAIADEAAVRKRLAAVKSSVSRDAERARSKLTSDLTRKAELARKAGDVKTWDKIEEEIKAFEQDGVLPKSVPTKIYEGEVRKLRARVEAAYSALIKEYTNDGKLEQAKAAQQEFEDFASGFSNSVKEMALFDGKTLDGWRQSSMTTWEVNDGQMIGKGRGPVDMMIRDDTNCTDFTLRCRLIPPEDDKSCIAFWVDDKRQGGIYPSYWVIVARESFGQLRRQTGLATTKLLASPNAIALKEGESVELEIVVHNRHLTVRANEQILLNEQELLEPKAGGLIAVRPGLGAVLKVSEMTLIKQDEAE